MKIIKVMSVVVLGLVWGASAVTHDSASVLSTLHAVADWQLSHPSKHALTDWTQGAGYAGFMALSKLPGGRKYEDAMLEVGKASRWQPGGNTYHADDHCVGQMYGDLFARFHDPSMIKPLQERFDNILANPAQREVGRIIPTGPMRWWWCDALFMAPPAWARLAAVTGDKKYLDFMVKEWWATSEFLYDKDEHLFYRDRNYFVKREGNGRKVFWSRGNGWVMGGVVRVLQVMPADHPERGRFVEQYKQMAARIMGLQQADGLWRSSLLDPENYPLKETSGSGFFCYALAWGINNGLLDRATTLPTVEKAWAALVACVTPEGKLTHVQPIGADPRKFDPGTTEVYGVGAFLLAGCEIYHLAQPAGTVVAAEAIVTTVTVENPLATERPVETIEIPWAAPNATVLEAGIPIPSQRFEGKLLFQSSFGPGQSKTFIVTNAPAPEFPVRAYGRYVPERCDDYAWENDRIAFRIYGPGLEKDKTGALVSSGVDVWLKRTRELVVNKRYQSRNYHKDHGDGLDNYSCGPDRGCGGIGVLTGGRLHVSRNWATQKTLATGPIRTVAEITYAPWDCGAGIMVAETRRIILDAGSNLNRFESRFEMTGTNAVVIAVGLDVSKARNHNGAIAGGADKGFFVNWEPDLKPNGNTATAILVPGTPGEGRDKAHVLLTASVKPGELFVWYAGAGWSKSGDFADAAAWTAYVEQFSVRLKTPLKITSR